MEMLGEPAHVTNERVTINGILTVLKNAGKVLKKDPEFIKFYLVLPFMKEFKRNKCLKNQFNNQWSKILQFKEITLNRGQFRIRTKEYKDHNNKNQFKLQIILYLDLIDLSYN